MQYSIWRVGPDGEALQLGTVGITSNKDRALEKARSYNERLKLSDPESEDRFVARDEQGRELRAS